MDVTPSELRSFPGGNLKGELIAAENVKKGKENKKCNSYINE